MTTERELNWTKEAPGIPGWYWLDVRSGDSCRTLQVVCCAEFAGSIRPMDDGGWTKIDGAQVKWAGPIPEPTDD